MTRLCPHDGMPLRTEALAFLHQKIHGLPPGSHHYGELSLLPFSLFEKVAEVMQEFAEEQRKQVANG